MRQWIAVSVAALLLCRGAAGQTPTDSALSGITARGRLLAQHDAASWQATDALQSLTKDISDLNVSVALPDSIGGWIVHFGRLSSARDTFAVLFTAEPASDGRHYEARRHSPPKVGSDHERIVATAVLTALKEFGAPTRPYNSYGLAAEDGSVWVYFVPPP